jgi:hypothetical protein
MADSKSKDQQDSPAPVNPSASQDPNLPDGPDLDPTKVVGTYAEQPDPNADRPAPGPNVPPGVNKAPKDDEPGAPAIGDGDNV